MGKAALKICIPESLSFADLDLGRNRDGMVSFNYRAIETLCAASGLDVNLFIKSGEDNVAGLIINWYHAHIANGGAPDAVAEDLILEAKMESAHGGGFSLPTGRA